METLIEIMESTANMLRGMTLDPAIPQHAKSAMWGKISELEMAVELANKSICDACGKPVDDSENVGHECNLHKNCAGFTVVELLCVLGILCSLAFGGFLLYVGWHFVSKFW